MHSALAAGVAPKPVEPPKALVVAAWPKPVDAGAPKPVVAGFAAPKRPPPVLVLAPKPVDAVLEPKPPPPPKAGAEVVLPPPKREEVVPVAPKAGLAAGAPNAPVELPNPADDVSVWSVLLNNLRCPGFVVDGRKPKL